MIKAWHFINNKLILNNDDGRKVGVGKPISVEPPIRLCKHGLHASPTIIDALFFYQEGDVLTYVDLGGFVTYCETQRKFAASTRTIFSKLSVKETNRLIHEISIRVAGILVARPEKYGIDHCYGSAFLNSIEVKKLWLRKKVRSRKLHSVIRDFHEEDFQLMGPKPKAVADAISNIKSDLTVRDFKRVAAYSASLYGEIHRGYEYYDLSEYNSKNCSGPPIGSRQ